MEEISLVVNGSSYELKVPKNRTLLKTLREDLHLTGTKAGCETGDCGSCKVLLDGRAVNSCTFPAFRADGKSVVTIEGIAGPEGLLHPVQQAFIDAGAIQCGFCTPGMVITVMDLLAEHTNPDEEMIRNRLSGQICRCTGYVKIVDAVKLAIAYMKEK